VRALVDLEMGYDVVDDDEEGEEKKELFIPMRSTLQPIKIG
jgi:hypothetical protein